MPVETWDKDEIKKLAFVSGKPLEVECAEVFLRAGWQVRLGAYYNDASTEKVRELDLLIHKNRSWQIGSTNWEICIRVLGSCKGFPPEHGPVTYSVSSQSNSVYPPAFISQWRNAIGTLINAPLGERGAKAFLARTKLAMGRQVVGFDIIQRKEIQKKPAQFEYSRKTDRDLYEGLDSAIKASVYWDRNEWLWRQCQGRNSGYVVLNIPLLVTSQPFWDVSIDKGIPTEPELKHSGYHVGYYPFAGKEGLPAPILSLLWEVSKLSELTPVLDTMIEFLFDRIEEETNH